MSSLLDSDDRNIYWPPPASLGSETEVACPGLASEASERDVHPFPRRGVGLGTLVGQPVRETIGFAAVCAGGCFKLLVDVSDWPPPFLPSLEFLGTPLSGRNGQVSMQRSRGKEG
jgi:hypothetical protein